MPSHRSQNGDLTMPEIEDECIFTTKADQIKFTTLTNSGDIIIISGLNLNQGQAASLSWLVNHNGALEFQVKVKP